MYSCIVPDGSTPSPARLAVLISGGGRTLFNLIDAINRGIVPASVALVIASADTAGAKRAREAGLPIAVIPGRIPREKLESVLEAHRIDWVVLAGYLKLVDIPPSFEGKVINIHPALLPKHGGNGLYGHFVHESVLRSGDTVSGCTVHYCDSKYDTGPIILQKQVPVLAGDTPESLASRVFEAECAALPEALAMILSKERA